MSRPVANAEIQIDNGYVRVTRWTFPPGGETGEHRHGFDYVVVPITTGALTIESADGVVTAELETSVAYNRSAGVEHNVINNNDYEFVFVEIELLDKSG